MVGPATCTTWPSTTPSVAIINPNLSFFPAAHERPLQSGSATHDFDNFARNRSLTNPVHVQSKGLNNITRIRTRRIHSGQRRCVLGRIGFEHGAIDRHFDVTRKKVAQQLLWRLLVNVINLFIAAFGYFDREHLTKHDVGGHRTLELIDRDVNSVCFSPAVKVNHLRGDLTGMLDRRAVDNAKVFTRYRVVAATKIITTFAADRFELHGSSAAFVDKALSTAKQIRVKCTSKTAVAADKDHLDPIFFANLQ